MLLRFRRLSCEHAFWQSYLDFISWDIQCFTVLAWVMITARPQCGSRRSSHNTLPRAHIHLRKACTRDDAYSDWGYRLQRLHHASLLIRSLKVHPVTLPLYQILLIAPSPIPLHTTRSTSLFLIPTFTQHPQRAHGRKTLQFNPPAQSSQNITNEQTKTNTDHSIIEKTTLISFTHKR